MCVLHNIIFACAHGVLCVCCVCDVVVDQTETHTRIVFIAGTFRIYRLSTCCVMASIPSMRLISHNKIPENYGPLLRPRVCLPAQHRTIYVMTRLGALLMGTAVLSAKPQVYPRPDTKRRARS